MNKNLTLYVTGHNDYEFDQEYIDHYKDKIDLQIINVNNTVWEYPNVFSLNAFLCEFTTFYYVWKNNLQNDYVGFCHYRRTLPVDDIERYIDVLNDDYIVFDRTSCFSGVFFPLIEKSTIYDSFENYLKSFDINMFDIYKEVHDRVPGRALFITSFNNFRNLANFIFGFVDKIIPEHNVINFVRFMNNEIARNYVDYNESYFYTRYNFLDYNIYRFWAFVLEYMCGLFIEYDSRINNKNIIEHLIVYGK